jgi:recombination protein RecA
MNKTLIKKYGDLAFIGGDELEPNDDVVSVSPRLDVILGGGIPGGSFVTLSGDPKCGKTTTSLCIARNAQQQGRRIFYLNVEGRLKHRDLKGIKGLDSSKDTFQIIRSYRDDSTGKIKILTAEEYLDIGEHIIKTVPNSVLIIDSVSQLVGAKELDGDMGDKHRAPGAILMSQFLKKIQNTVPVNNNIVISIVHLIANTSGMGASKKESGGNKIKFACDVGLRCKYFKFKRPGGKDDDDNSKPPYGQEVMWQTTSTAVAAPGQQITSYLRYGIGIDEVLETLIMAVDMQIVEKSGAWYKYGEEGKSVQGEEKMCSYLIDNPEMLTEIQEKIREILY